MKLLSKIIRRILNTIQYRNAGLNKGKNVKIRYNVFFDIPESIFIGNNSFINYGSSFFVGLPNNATITIGNNVYIGMNCTFTCVSHEMGNEKQRAGINKYKDIVIENGAWIGASVTILQGVNIAKGCVVAAGAVVTKSTEPNGLYAGVPAKRIKDLEEV